MSQNDAGALLQSRLKQFGRRAVLQVSGYALWGGKREIRTKFSHLRLADYLAHKKETFLVPRTLYSASVKAGI